MTPLPLAEPPRECGPCTACCHAIYVSEIHKEPYEDCPSMLGRFEHSCSVYGDRSEACVVYRCLWLEAEFSWPVDRPDLSGVIIDTSVSPELCAEIVAEVGQVSVVVARKTDLTGPWSSRALELIEWLARSFVVLKTEDFNDAIPWAEVLAPTEDQVEVTRRVFGLAPLVRPCGAPDPEGSPTGD